MSWLNKQWQGLTWPLLVTALAALSGDTVSVMSHTPVTSATWALGGRPHPIRQSQGTHTWLAASASGLNKHYHYLLEYWHWRRVKGDSPPEPGKYVKKEERMDVTEMGQWGHTKIVKWMTLNESLESHERKTFKIKNIVERRA